MTQETQTPEEVALQESLAAAAKEEIEHAAKAEAKFGDQSKVDEVEVARLAEEARVKAEDEAKVAAEAKADEEAKAKMEAEGGTSPEPKPRNKEVDAIVALRKQGQLLHDELLLVKGQNQALAEMVRSGSKQPAEKQQTADEALAALDEAKLVAADKVDKGEMTVREYEQERSKLEREARAIERQVEQSQRKPEPQVHQEDLYLAEKTEALAQQFPFLEDLTAEDLAPFHKLALKQAEREGNPIQTGPLETLRLRTLMLNLAAKVYQPETPVPVAKPTNDAAAKALAAKLALQEKMPPDTSNMGSVGTTAGLTESELERSLNDPHTTDAQAEALIASLSPALRDKLGVR